jgi:mono/diheme cytochrome c family protein
MHKKVALLIVIGIFAVAGLLNSAGSIWAHGDEEHPQKRQKSAHMQAMYALKDKIPTEYRIMERTPIHPDEESLSRGQEIYAQQCAMCHGSEGRGDGPAASGLKTTPANFLDRGHSAIYGPGEKFWIIGNGSGETGMPPFPHIEVIDRWHLVNHIFNLQENGDHMEGDEHKH